MKIVFPKYLNPVVVSPNIILNYFIITLGRSLRALPDFFDSRLSRVVEFLRMSYIWNLRKLIMIPQITKFRMKAATIVTAET